MNDEQFPPKSSNQVQSSRYFSEMTSPQITFDLSRGAPPLETVPAEYIAGSKTLPGLGEIVTKYPETLLYKGSGVHGNNFKGYGPLREVLALEHGVDPDQVIIRNGGMDAMTHVLVYLLWQREESGKTNRIAVATEIPTYDRFPQNLQIHGIEWRGVPLTPKGLDLDRLEELLKNGEIQMFYGIYEGQNPSSYSYRDEEIRAVETLCARYDVLVLWDGAYHRLTYGREREEIRTPGSNVILQRNYTKEISAGLKCGYLVVPKELAPKFDFIVSNSGLNPNYPTQAWIHAFITSPHYVEHIAKLKELFSARLNALREALQKYSPEAIYNKAVDSGYFLEIDYPDVPERSEFEKALGEQGVAISDSTLSYPPAERGTVQGKIRFPFAVFNPEQIDEIARRIAQAHQQVPAK